MWALAALRICCYELCDDDGAVLERVSHAALDRGWWQTFQPLEPHYG
jgi:hypothetical protein